MLVSQGKTGSNGNARNSGWRKRVMAMDLVFEGVLIDVLDRGACKYQGKYKRRRMVPRRISGFRHGSGGADH
jgi:hypothetical protein